MIGKLCIVRADVDNNGKVVLYVDGYDFADIEDQWFAEMLIDVCNNVYKYVEWKTPRTVYVSNELTYADLKNAIADGKLAKAYCYIELRRGRERKIRKMISKVYNDLGIDKVIEEYVNAKTGHKHCKAVAITQ